MKAEKSVTAEDCVWDAYIKAHPDARSYRVKTVPCYHKLCVIYRQDKLEGVYSSLADSISPTTETPGDGKDEDPSASIDAIEGWTVSMERNLLNQNGFAWDETLQMIVADNDVWESYKKEHPDSILHRDKILPQYNDLSIIFGPTEIVEGEVEL
ncbi:hypothetical protein Fot_43224 [Forsythia ovata]|uniref:Myb/SANT-like domain-containing protein n=1 Tax=Forsythia ovata TaxID=205694 RepID=A0ABD1RNE5_9LAMI